MGDAYATVFLVLYGGYTLILLTALGLGLWLVRRGNRWPGLIVLGLLGAWCIGPPLVDRANAYTERRAIDAVTLVPESLSFEGQTVLVIEAGNTICGDFCGDLVKLGVPGEFYWLGIGNFSGGEVPNRDFGIIDAGAQILRVRLGDPVENMGDMRFVEPVERAVIPPFDVVIVDDNGYLRSYAPDILGLPDALVPRTQIARVLIEGWPDPFSGAPPAPTYRTVAPWMDVRAFVYWPLSTNDGAYPPIDAMDRAWNSAICSDAGAPDARDAFTYGYLCDRDSLNSLFE